MRALNIVRRDLKGPLEFLHAKTFSALWRGVHGLVKGDQLWLTALGRSLPGESTHKHRIKAADRLLGNEQIQSQLLEILKTNGEPGWLVLQRGMTKLLAYEQGWLARKSSLDL